MKKLLFGVFVLLFALSSFAIAPAAPTVYANKFLESYPTLSKAANFDTLVGVDSAVVFNKQPIPSGGSAYILSRGAVTGTGSDSVKIQVVVDSYDANNVLLYRTSVDSFTVSTAEDIAIPFFDTIFGDRFTLKLIGYTANGGQVILPNMRFYVRKLVDFTKSINF